MPGDIDYDDFIEAYQRWASQQLREDYWDYFGNRWDYDDWEYNKPEVDNVDEEVYEVPIKRGDLREKKRRKLGRLATGLCFATGLCVFASIMIVGLIINEPDIIGIGAALTVLASIVVAIALAIYAILLWWSNRTERKSKTKKR